MATFSPPAVLATGSITKEVGKMAKLSKFTQGQIDQALAQKDPATTARMLSVIHRCGNSRERAVVDNLAMTMGLCPKYLVMSGGCLVMKE